MSQQSSPNFPPQHTSPHQSYAQLGGGAYPPHGYGIKREMLEGDRMHKSPPRPDSTMGPNYAESMSGRSNASSINDSMQREKHGKRGKGNPGKSTNSIFLPFSVSNYCMSIAPFC
jgi:hypothetical protein